MASQQGGGGARPKTPRQGSGPTQQASAPAKEGWLFLPAGTTLFGLVKRQKRRYCVLEGQSRLVIYKDRTKTKVKAVYPLQLALGVTATILHSGYVVEVRMTGNEPPLVLASRDQADMLDWIDSLDGAIFFARRTARPAGPLSLGGFTDKWGRLSLESSQMGTLPTNGDVPICRPVRPHLTGFEQIERPHLTAS